MFYRLRAEHVQVSDCGRGNYVESHFVAREFPRFLEPPLYGEVRPGGFGIYELAHIASHAQVALGLSAEARLRPVLIYICIVEEYVRLREELRHGEPYVLGPRRHKLVRCEEVEVHLDGFVDRLLESDGPPFLSRLFIYESGLGEHAPRRGELYRPRGSHVDREHFFLGEFHRIVARLVTQQYALHDERHAARLSREVMSGRKAGERP